VKGQVRVLDLFTFGKEPRRLFNRILSRTQRQSGCFEDKENLLPLPGIEPRIFLPATISTVFSRVTHTHAHTHTRARAHAYILYTCKQKESKAFAFDVTHVSFPTDYIVQVYSRSYACYKQTYISNRLQVRLKCFLGNGNLATIVFDAIVLLLPEASHIKFSYALASHPVN
jgi:hypothetical protein